MCALSRSFWERAISMRKPKPAGLWLGCACDATKARPKTVPACVALFSSDCGWSSSSPGAAAKRREIGTWVLRCQADQDGKSARSGWIVMGIARPPLQGSPPLQLRSGSSEDPDEQVMGIAVAPPQASPPLQLRSRSSKDSDEQVMGIAIAPPQASLPLHLRSRSPQDPDEQVMGIAIAPPQASPPLQLRSRLREHPDEQVTGIALAPSQASPPLQLRSRSSKDSDEQVMGIQTSLVSHPLTGETGSAGEASPLVREQENPSARAALTTRPNFCVYYSMCVPLNEEINSHAWTSLDTPEGISHRLCLCFLNAISNTHGNSSRGVRCTDESDPDVAQCLMTCRPTLRA
jgi:hypothetical protein